LPTAELCCKHGLSPVAFYKLNAKYGGMDLSDAKRLNQFAEENATLKRLVVDVMLDNVVLENLLRAETKPADQVPKAPETGEA